MLSCSWVFFVERVCFRDYHKNIVGSICGKSTNLGYKIQKHMAGKFTRAGTSFVRKYTNRIFEPKEWHSKYEILKNTERYNFCWKYFPTKSTRTALQTYKVGERTFGTPCIWPAIKDLQLGSHCSGTCLSYFQCCVVMVFRWNCPISREREKDVGGPKFQCQELWLAFCKGMC